jgi:hypothetical protein
MTFLHPRRVTGAFFQTQEGVGGHAPFATAFAVTARAPHGDGAKARVESARMIGAEAGEFLLADRTVGRTGIGLGLRAALRGLAQQGLDILSGLNFEVPEVLIAGQREVLDRMFQRTRRARRQDRQWFARRNTP